MFKKIAYLFSTCYLLLAGQLRAQDSAACGLTKAYMLAHAVSGSSLPEGLISPKAYHAGSTDTCGKIIMFYEDAEIALTGPDEGFAEPGGIGTTRRNTMCAVLQYIQSVFDFSKIPPGEFLKINVSRSSTASYPARLKDRLTTYGVSCPYWDSTHNVNGFFYDFVKSGVDPVTTDSGYHGELAINFDSCNSAFLDYYSTGKLISGGIIKVNMHNDLSVPEKCSIDLYTVGLHFMGHIMGFIDWRDRGTHLIKDTSFVSTFRSSLYMGPNPDTSYNPIDPAVLLPIPTTGYPPPGRYWVNNKTTPENIPVDYAVAFAHIGAHGSSYASWARISPGDIQHYVMEYAIVEGLAKRKYLKGDLETFHNIVGYDYNPTYASDSAAIIANHTAWSTKMAYRYNIGLAKPNFMDVVPADFIVTNDSGASMVIHLGSDTTFRDSDGDTLSILPGSIVNFRGCGEGNNNHNLLTVSNSNRTITYSPRHNFYGRAQFGFNLWDGKEKGAFILYTIDILKGNNVSVTKGTNMVQNGDIENGEEVRLKFTHENVNNSAFHVSSYMSGRFGYNLPDGMPYPCPSAIRNSYSECTLRPANSYGSFDLSFPPDSPTGEVEVIEATVKTFLKNPEPVLNAGNRYLTKKHATLHYLNDTVKPCKRYRMEFDACLNWHDTSSFGNDTLFLGFTCKDSVAAPYSTHLLQRYAGQPVKGLKYADWRHFKYEFTYCNDTPSTVMYFHFQRVAKTKLVDNISLIELDDIVTLAVNIKDSISGKCKSRLYADLDSMGCPMTYSWKTIDGATVGNTRAIEVNTNIMQTYTLDVTDGCGRTASDTFTITPCPCSVGAVFGAGHDSVVSGTLTTSLLPGIYHVDGDITIASSLDFTGAKMLIEPNVKLTVDPNVKLTIDNSHLLVCPDTNKLWKGIELTGAANSAKIEVRNNSMIEDAEIAIRAMNPGTTGGGNIIDIQNSVFNRNLKSVNIENYTVSTGDTIYPFVFKGSVYTSRNFDTGGAYPSVWPDPIGLKTQEDNGVRAPYRIDRVYTKTDTAKNGMPLEAAIKLRNVGAKTANYYQITIGGASGLGFEQNHHEANLFDHTCTGIYSDTGNLAVYNNIFINMSRPDVPFPVGGLPGPYYWGHGVHATGNFSNNLLLVKDYLINFTPVNKFFDCRQGVTAMGFYDVNISSCRMSSSQTTVNYKSETGIDVSCGRFNRCDVSLNTISNMTSGIKAGANSFVPGGQFKVNSNVLSAVNPDLSFGTGSAGQAMYYGMSIGSGILPSTGGTPAVAEISSNHITGASNGIRISNTGKMKLQVNNNDIILHNWGITQYGIYVTNSDAVDVSVNRISAPSLGGNDHMRGVYVTFSTNVSVCSNTATDVNRGFDFNLWRAQPGCRWIGNTMTGNSKGFVLGSDIGDQGSVRDRSTGIVTYEAILDNWTGFGSGKVETFVENKRDTRLSKLFVRNGATPNELPTINRATIATASYPEIYHISGSLVTRTNESNCRGVLDMGPRPYSFGTIGGIILAAATGYDSTERPLEWMTQMALYEMGSIDPEWRDSSLVLDSFMTAATDSRFEWLTAIGMALDSGDISSAQTLLGSPVSAMGVNTLSNTITVTDYTEADAIAANYVRYYDRYIRFLQGSMNGSDTVYIQDLATKCPALDGAIVFKARALYDWLADTVIVYQDDSCMDRGNSLFKTTPASPAISSMTEATDGYTLYPNPNNGSFTLKQKIPSDIEVEVKLYNALGMQIGREKVQFMNGLANFKVQYTSAGLYLICLTDGNNKTSCIKFNIQ
ncbi:MAG: T9SS type A sorting domain-containing protein [Chitinophagaceae bacterium]|jgi:hypothetical protein